MLFIFPKTGMYGFWMKDTLIPLDIIWMDDNQTVVYIEKNAAPCLKDPCPSYGSSYPSRYVLEINSGVALEKHINPGDRAVFYPDASPDVTSGLGRSSDLRSSVGTAKKKMHGR